MKGRRRRRWLSLALALLLIVGLSFGPSQALATGKIEIQVDNAKELYKAIEQITKFGENGQENIIRLTKDIDLTGETADLLITKDTVLLGQGHEIDLGQVSFTIIRGATLSLGKEAPAGDENVLKLTSTATKDAPRSLAAIFVAGYDPDITEDVLSPGNLKMYDGVELTGLISNGDYGASAVLVNYGTFDLYGGKIHNNKVYLTHYSVGAAVYVDGSYVEDPKPSAIFKMHGGEISSNWVKPDSTNDTEDLIGGGVNLYKAEMQMTAGKICDNVLEDRGDSKPFHSFGAGIYADSSTITLKGQKPSDILISGNKGAGSGGALDLVKTNATIEKATISNNQTTHYGGGLTLGDDCQATVKDVVFEHNESKFGGAIFLPVTGKLDCSEGTIFRGNKAVVGGAIYTLQSDKTDTSKIQDYQELKADTSKYQNIHTDATTVFDQNQATFGLFVPPSNWAAFTNLGYKQDPALHNPTGVPSPLNNADINYTNRFFFVAYDGNGAAGSMPTTAYPIGSSQKVTLPENAFEVPQGKVFDGWMINGEKKAVGAEITVQENTTVVAQWKKVVKPNPNPNPNPNPGVTPEPQPETPKTSTERLGGDTRIETAIQLSKANYSESEQVVLARADQYPDALAASVLAKALDAPILLTNSKEVTPAVKAEIERLGAKKALLVGGESALSKEIVDQLKTLGEVDRIGGQDRYETSALIAKTIAKLKGNPEKVILATGLGYADALSISPYAAKMGYPILLTATKQLPKVVAKTIEELKVQSAIVIGGVNVVAESVVKALPKDCERIGGATRFESSALIAERFFPKAKVAYLTSGENFADALVVGPIAGKLDRPVLLTGQAALPDSISKLIQKAAYEKVIIIGGENAVSKAIADAIK